MKLGMAHNKMRWFCGLTIKSQVVEINGNERIIIIALTSLLCEIKRAFHFVFIFCRAQQRFTAVFI